MIFRKIEFEDACGLFAVRIATREKRVTMEPLAEMGITPDSTAYALFVNIAGWLCEILERSIFNGRQRWR